MIDIGSIAPDFALKDQNGAIVKLTSLRGKKVILSFRPLAWTPVCTDQMKSLENNFEQLARLKAVALGIGIDSSASNKAWAKVMEIGKIKLLADFWPHGEVARSYGVFREQDGFSERANIILDEKQKVIFARVYPTGHLPEIEEILTFLKTNPR